MVGLASPEGQAAGGRSLPGIPAGDLCWFGTRENATIMVIGRAVLERPMRLSAGQVRSRPRSNDGQIIFSPAQPGPEQRSDQTIRRQLPEFEPRTPCALPRQPRATRRRPRCGHQGSGGPGNARSLRSLRAAGYRGRHGQDRGRSSVQATHGGRSARSAESWCRSFLQGQAASRSPHPQWVMRAGGLSYVLRSLDNLTTTLPAGSGPRARRTGWPQPVTVVRRP